MATPWYQYPITQAHGQNGEQGVDLGVPFHTPITALFAGTVRFAGRTQWACGSSGGEITIVCNVPGLGNMTSYYLHTDNAQVKAGDTVQQGQIIALSGGQLSGGQWPVINCPSEGDIYSTGPHIEFGFNAPWVSGPGHLIDPTPYILAARAGTLPQSNPDGTGTFPLAYTNPTGGGSPQQTTYEPNTVQGFLAAIWTLSSRTHRVITQPTGFDGFCEDLDYHLQWTPWNWLNPIGSIFVNVSPALIRATGAAFGILVAYLVLLRMGINVAHPIQSIQQKASGALGALPRDLPADRTGASLPGAGAAPTGAAAGPAAALAEAPEIAAI